VDEAKSGSRPEFDTGHPPEEMIPTAACALSGPTGSGKTHLAMAMCRSCAVPDPEAPDLRVWPLLSAELTRDLAEFQFGDFVPGPSSDSVATYELEVDLPPADETAHTRWRRWTESISALRWPHRSRLRAGVEIIDGPGGAMLPMSQEREKIFNCGHKLASLVEGAQSLILCVNAAKPAVTALYSELPVFLTRITQRDGFLPFRAVLVLLTQVDLLAASFIDSARRFREVKRPSAALEFLRDNPKATPLFLCRCMEPWQMARSTLGDGILLEIWKRIAPGCRFGVGIVSAAGFDPATGEPSKLLPAHRRTSGWHPFGVDEALYFCLSGEKARDRASATLVAFVKDERPRLPFHLSTEIALEARP